VVRFVVPDPYARIARRFWPSRSVVKAERSEYDALNTGPLHSFRDALHEALPLTCIGVYTIWRGTEFMYVGIAGRNLDVAAEHKRMRGVRDRLDSNRSGRRSGDQFAVYVCDRLVLPTLSRDQIQQVAAGELSLEALTRVYIHENLSYRFAPTMSYKEALKIERSFARGKTEVGSLLRNPGRPIKTRWPQMPRRHL
jgi:hypothetical protein